MAATSRVVPGVVAVSTTAVDPKVRNSAGAVAVAAFVAGVILSGLGRWHAFAGLDESTKRYLAGAVLSVVTGATVWLVGFWTSHGEPILAEVEAKAAAVIGPDELAAAVADITGAVKGIVAEHLAGAAGPVVVQAAAPVILTAPAEATPAVDPAVAGTVPDAPATEAAGDDSVLDLSTLTTV